MAKSEKIRSCEKRCQSLKNDLANANTKISHLNAAIKALSSALNRKDALNAELSKVLVSENWTGTRYAEFSNALRNGGSICDNVSQYFRTISEIKSNLEKEEQRLSAQASNISGQINKAMRDLKAAQDELSKGTHQFN